MTTAIIGLGNMGKGLAKRLGGRTDLVLGVRDPVAAAAFAKSVGASATTYRAAVEQADIVILAVPFAKALDLAKALPLAGKIVVDISNPITPDFSGLTIGHSTSAAEELAKVAPGAKLVKAFNTIFSGLFDLPASATASVPVFVAGNDATAVDAVAALTETAGFAVERAGGLDGARLLEPVGMLNIRLGYALGHGTAIAPNWLRIAA